MQGTVDEDVQYARVSSENTPGLFVLPWNVSEEKGGELGWIKRNFFDVFLQPLIEKRFRSSLNKSGVPWEQDSRSGI